MRRAALVVTFVCGCRGGDPPPAVGSAPLRGPPPRPALSLSKPFAGPEKVYYDAAADVYLVSSLNGDPQGVDDNGYITRLAPTGDVLAERWIDGARPEVTLHAPRGMVMDATTLYVADVGAVRRFDRKTGAPRGDWEVPGSTFLNDLAVDEQGRVLVTDSAVYMSPSGPIEQGTDAIYRFDAQGRVETVASGQELLAPDGIVVAGGRILVAPFLGEAIYAVVDGKPQPVAVIGKSRLDGLVALSDGGLLVSSWEAKGVFHIDAAGHVAMILDNLVSPASIAYDGRRAALLVPQLLEGALRIEAWSPPSAR